mmetsp:Transcript_100362/g.266792  ORF Transcript_100362/g.266792 Transcript_100362/m.266792 type:complete len:214 (-) Transcript_100362:3-644(-)
MRVNPSSFFSFGRLDHSSNSCLDKTSNFRIFTWPLILSFFSDICPLLASSTEDNFGSAGAFAFGTCTGGRAASVAKGATTPAGLTAPAAVTVPGTLIGATAVGRAALARGAMNADWPLLTWSIFRFKTENGGGVLGAVGLAASGRIALTCVNGPPAPAAALAPSHGFARMPTPAAEGRTAPANCGPPGLITPGRYMVAGKDVGLARGTWAKMA